MSGIRWRSLRTKIIAWSFVPTAIILAAVALVTYYAYQQVTAELVIERDQDLTRLLARQVATELAEYSDTLVAEARVVGSYGEHPAVQRTAIERAGNRLVVFDGGVLILNTFGTVIAAEPDRPEVLGQDWSKRAYFRQMVRSPKVIFSNIVTDGPQDAAVIVVAVPVTGNQGEFLGILAGMFRLNATAVSAFYGSLVKLRLGESGSTYLVDSNGRVIYHTEADYIGQDFSTQAVVQQVLNGEAGAIRTSDFDGRDIVAGFAPVPGLPWGLVTQESWTNLTSGSQGYERFLLLLLALGVIVPALVVAIGVRRITNPITALIGAAQAVAGGDFGQTITASTGDEIEDLAEQFNRMSAQLQVSYNHLERMVAERTRELATLSAIAAVVSRSLDLDEILNDALNKSLQVMGVEAGVIYLLNKEAGVLTVTAQRGFNSQFVAEIDRLKVGEGITGRVAQSGQPLVVKDVSADPRLARMVVREERLRSLACVPLSSKEKVLGVLFAVTRGYREFTDQDVGLLTAIGHQIGVAIENARLYEQAQQVAVLEERQRLARDLHDSATQSLYAVTMFSEAATRLLTSGEIEAAASHLYEVRETAQEALQEMRLLIFELRPPILEREGLAIALQTRLEMVEGRSGLKTEFNAEEISDLPPEIEEGLYRIAQEALNNILKHAQAHRVTVHLCRDQQKIIMEITDDGIGFDPAMNRGKGGLGLEGMKERAALLGGQLMVRSKPGQGTSVWVEVS